MTLSKNLITIDKINQYKNTLNIGDKLELDCLSQYTTNDEIEFRFIEKREFEITGIFPNFVTVKGSHPNILYYADMLCGKCVL